MTDKCTQHDQLVTLRHSHCVVFLYTWQA